jgi:cytoskeleton protein RodZ
MFQNPDHGTMYVAAPPGAVAQIAPGSYRKSEPNIGALLRAERERRGWALTDVAEFLRIRRVMLEAIETGNYGALPGRVYVTAFLRTYGELLGFDPDEVVERYREETEAARPASDSRGLAVKLPELAKLYPYLNSARAWARARWAETAPVLPAWPVTPRAGAIGGGALALLFGAWLFSGSSTPTDTAREQLAQRASAPVSENAAARPGSSSPPTQAFQPMSNPSAAFATPAWASPPGPGAPAPSAVSAPAASNVAAAPAAAASRISVRATDRTFVEIRDSGGTSLVARELRRGATLDIPNQPGLVLTSARLNNLEFVVDGRQVASQARQGRRDVQLDPDRLLRSQAQAPRRDRPAQPQQPQRNPSQNQNQNRQQR